MTAGSGISARFEREAFTPRAASPSDVAPAQIRAGWCRPG
jgi:hypothetical protein